MGLSGKSDFGYAIWAGEEDDLHSKAFRVGHKGNLYCNVINDGGAASVIQTVYSEDGTTYSLITTGKYKIIAGTYTIGSGEWARVCELTGDCSVIGG